MTRIFYDSDNPADIPDRVDGVMGYVDGYAAAAWDGPQGFARFQRLGVPIITIAVSAAHNAQMLDQENGDATPEQCPGWAARQRSLGNPHPIVYTAESTYQQVRDQFHTQGVDEPLYVLAAYPGTAPNNGPVIYPWPNVIGHQYADPPGSGGHYDLSAMADHIPGVDPSQEDDMTPDQANQLAAVAAAIPDIVSRLERLEDLSFPAFDHAVAHSYLGRDDDPAGTNYRWGAYRQSTGIGSPQVQAIHDEVANSDEGKAHAAKRATAGPGTVHALVPPDDPPPAAA